MITNTQSGTNITRSRRASFASTPRSRCRAIWRSTSTNTSSSTTRRCSFTRAHGAVPAGREAIRASCRSSGCATSASRTSRPTSVARSTSCSPWRRMRCRSAAAAAMVSVNDFADRAPRALADGEVLSLGRHACAGSTPRTFRTRWECGLMLEISTRTLLLRRSVHPGRRGRGWP